MNALAAPVLRSPRDTRIIERLTGILRAAGLTVVSQHDVEQGLDWRVQTWTGLGTVRCRWGRSGLLPEAELVTAPGDAPFARAVIGQALTSWAQGQLSPGDFLARDYDWTDVVNAGFQCPQSRAGDGLTPPVLSENDGETLDPPRYPNAKAGATLGSP